MENPFKWRHYESEIILLCVRWYLRYALSHRDLEEMMTERGLSVVHTTIYRWVQAYAPEIDRRCRPHLRQTNDSWRVDETYVKVRGQWMYLYRALDSAGNTLDFLLNATRSRRAAKRFFRKVLGGKHVTAPRVINVDKNPTYIGAVRDLKREKLLAEGCKRRPSQYMNNIIEQDHRFMKRRIRPGLGFLYVNREADKPRNEDLSEDRRAVTFVGFSAIELAGKFSARPPTVCLKDGRYLKPFNLVTEVSFHLQDCSVAGHCHNHP